MMSGEGLNAYGEAGGQVVDPLVRLVVQLGLGSAL
jgi:hypothetical protein